MDLNSLERVIEYLDLPQEPLDINPNFRPPAYWPSKTCSGPLVTVENLSIRYDKDLPNILHNLSFTLNPREKIGLVGRTGSGAHIRDPPSVILQLIHLPSPPHRQIDSGALVSMGCSSRIDHLL
jgi:ABC-type transport system involved in Fe-S cluster assembly fused permease/ATPase subunit